MFESYVYLFQVRLTNLLSNVFIKMLGVHLLHYTFSRPLEPLITTFGVFWYYNNNNQKTLLDLRQPPNGPCDADFRGPLSKKGHLGSL